MYKIDFSSPTADADYEAYRAALTVALEAEIARMNARRQALTAAFESAQAESERTAADLAICEYGLREGWISIADYLVAFDAHTAAFWVAQAAFDELTSIYNCTRQAVKEPADRPDPASTARCAQCGKTDTVSDAEADDSEYLCQYCWAEYIAESDE